MAMDADKLKARVKDYMLKACEAIRSKIRDLDLVASGSLLRSIRVEEDAMSFKIMARSYLDYLEFGREPTRRDAGGVLLPAIREWCRLKGIPERYAWVIARRIHQEGWPPRGDISNSVLKDLERDLNVEFRTWVNTSIKERIKRRI